MIASTVERSRFTNFKWTLCQATSMNLIHQASNVHFSSAISLFYLTTPKTFGVWDSEIVDRRSPKYGVYRLEGFPDGLPFSLYDQLLHFIRPVGQAIQSAYSIMDPSVQTSYADIQATFGPLLLGGLGAAM